jgi:hypothetical protein
VEELTGIETSQAGIIADAAKLAQKVEEVLTREAALLLAALSLSISESLTNLAPLLDG